jgi:hypothetical protein
MLKLEIVKEKILETFNKWFRRGKIPKYLKKARAVFMSKTDTNTPPVGKVRLIAVQPALSKLY